MNRSPLPSHTPRWIDQIHPADLARTVRVALRDDRIERLAESISAARSVSPHALACLMHCADAFLAAVRDTQQTTGEAHNAARLAQTNARDDLAEALRRIDSDLAEALHARAQAQEPA